MKQGKLIVFEGIDGAGKTTQVELLQTELALKGYPVMVIREPGGTLLGELIRSLLLNPDYRELDPKAEALLYIVARAQAMAQIILPSLEEKKVILVDRFVDSSLAYQGYGRGLDLSFLEQTNKAVVGDLLPALNFLLDLPPETGLARIAEQGKVKDRLETEGLAFYQRVRSGYLKLAARNSRRYRIIDARKSKTEVFAEILPLVEEVIDERKRA